MSEWATKTMWKQVIKMDCNQNTELKRKPILIPKTSPKFKILSCNLTLDIVGDLNIVNQLNWDRWFNFKINNY